LVPASQAKGGVDLADVIRASVVLALPFVTESGKIYLLIA